MNMADADTDHVPAPQPHTPDVEMHLAGNGAVRLIEADNPEGWIETNVLAANHQ